MVSKRCHARSTRQGGAAAVEFALVVLPLLVILFGIMQFGWLLSSHLMVNHATSAGSRVFAAQRGYDNPCTAAFLAVRNSSPRLTAAENIHMSCSVKGPSAQYIECGTCSGTSTTCSIDTCKTELTQYPGNPARITVTYPFSALIAISLPGLQMPTDLSATVTDQVQ